MLLLVALENHHFHSSTLVDLDLSLNRAAPEVCTSLHRFLRKVTALERLALAAMFELDIEAFLKAESVYIIVFLDCDCN